MQRADDVESGFSSDIESKYKKIYEDDINSFAVFSKKVEFKPFLIVLPWMGVLPISSL